MSRKTNTQPTEEQLLLFESAAVMEAQPEPVTNVPAEPGAFERFKSRVGESLDNVVASGELAVSGIRVALAERRHQRAKNKADVADRHMQEMYPETSGSNGSKLGEFVKKQDGKRVEKLKDREQRVQSKLGELTTNHAKKEDKQKSKNLPPIDWKAGRDDLPPINWKAEDHDGSRINWRQDHADQSQVVSPQSETPTPEAETTVLTGRVSSSPKPPVTPQSRQRMRHFRRQHRSNQANLRALELKMGYGESITDRSTHKDVLAQTNLGFTARNRHRRAARRYDSLTAKTNKLNGTEPEVNRPSGNVEQPRERRFNIDLRELFEPENLQELYTQVGLELRQRLVDYRTTEGLTSGHRIPTKVVNKIREQIHEELMADYVGVKKTPPSVRERIEQELQFIANPADREKAKRAAKKAAEEEALKTGGMEAVKPQHLDVENLQNLRLTISQAITDTVHSIKDSLGFEPNDKLSPERFDTVSEAVAREAIAKYLGTETVSDEVYGLIDTALNNLPRRVGKQTSSRPKSNDIKTTVGGREHQNDRIKDPLREALEYTAYTKETFGENTSMSVDSIKSRFEKLGLNPEDAEAAYQLLLEAGAVDTVLTPRVGHKILMSADEIRALYG